MPSTFWCHDIRFLIFVGCLMFKDKYRLFGLREIRESLEHILPCKKINSTQKKI